MSTSLQTVVPSLHAVSSSSEAVSTGALSILVVEPALDQLVRTVTALSTAGFHVTAAESFAQAKHFLGPHSPAVLLTSLRLGGYNGLHLVVRGKALQPKMAALVTSGSADATLQADAEALGATFVVTPVTADQLIASILKTYFRREDDQPIRPPFERRVSERRTLEPVDAVNIDRRGTDRRRPLPWLVPPNTHPS